MKFFAAVVVAFFALLPTVSQPANADQIRFMHAPCRVIDTRNGWGILSPGDVMGARMRKPVTPFLGGEVGCSIPPFATGVILNVAAIGPEGAGHVQVHAYSADVPVASRLNVTAGVTIAAELMIGFIPLTNFDIEIRSTVRTHIKADIVGYLTPDPETLVGEIADVVCCVDTTTDGLTVSALRVRTSGGSEVDVYAPVAILADWQDALVAASAGQCTLVTGFWVSETQFEVQAMPVLFSQGC